LEIVTQGLKQGAKPSPVVRANIFLNYFLEHLYRSRDWPFLLKNGTISSDSSNLEELDLTPLLPSATPTAGPGEYLNARRLVITTDEIGQLSPASVSGWSYDDVWAKVEDDKNAGLTGVPSCYATDPLKQHLLLYPVPAKSYTAKLRYYHLPDAISSAEGNDPTGGDDLIPDWPDDAGLILSVEAWAHRWSKDRTFAGAIQGMADQAIARVAATIRDEGRDGPRTMKFSKHFKRTRRR